MIVNYLLSNGWLELIITSYETVYCSFNFKLYLSICVCNNENLSIHRRSDRFLIYNFKLGKVANKYILNYKGIVLKKKIGMSNYTNDKWLCCWAPYFTGSVGIYNFVPKQRHRAADSQLTFCQPSTFASSFRNLFKNSRHSLEMFWMQMFPSRFT